MFPTPLPKTATVVARATVLAGTVTESFIVPWKGRLAEFGTHIDDAFVLAKAERLRDKLGVARVVVLANPTFDAFDCTGGYIIADTATEGAR